MDAASESNYHSAHRRARGRVAWDPKSKMIFASNGDGTVSVIHQEPPICINRGRHRHAKKREDLAFDLRPDVYFSRRGDEAAPARPDKGSACIQPGNIHVLVLKAVTLQM